MRKLFRKVLLRKHYIALSLSIVILGLTLINSNTNAKATVVGDNELSRVTTKQAKELNIDRWIQTSQNRLTAKEVLEKHSNSLNFNIEKTHIMKIANKQQTLYFVYIPIKGGAEKDSHYIMVFNDKGTIVEDYLLLGLKDKNNVHSLAYKNNQIVLDAIADNKGNLVSGYTVNANG
ncbi:hypothetical protein, partial [Paenibacillus larvae]